MKSIKILLTCLALIVSAIFLTACTEKSNSKKLIVGMELSYPPFEMTDKEGKPAGISVELAKALARHLEKELVIENLAFDGLIPSLKTGKIDLIISSMTITEERQKTIDFSDPYSRAYLSLLLPKKSSLSNVQELNAKDKKIAVKKGTTGHIFAMKYLPQASHLVLDKENAAVLEVVQGKADAFIYDQMTIFNNWQKHPDTTRAILKPFQNDYEYWGIALRQGDTELKTTINQFLQKFKQEGGFNKLAETYLPDIKKAFDELNIPFFFSS